MSYEKRKPPMTISLDVDKFNMLVEFITRMCRNENEELVTKVIQMKDKILRYSIPHQDEEGNVIIDLRLFQIEAKNMLDIFISNLKIDNISDNHYEKLLDIRKDIRKKLSQS